MIILTADRPSELIGTGANQTIQQRDLYGYQVRSFQDIGLPTEKHTSLISMSKRAFNISMGFNHSGKRVSPPGPVHLNIPFDEPLFTQKDLTCSVDKNVTKKRPEIVIRYPQNPIEKFSFLNNYSRPLIICGRMEPNQLRDEIINLAESIDAPIFADPVSQLRYGVKNPHIIPSYDHFLKSNNIQPDLVIRFGGKPTSKKLCILIDEWKNHTLLIAPVGRFNDDCPNILDGDPDFVINNLIDRIGGHKNEKWIEQIKQLEKQSREILDAKLIKSTFSGGNVARCCIDSLQSGDVLIAGNSLPIRELDSYTFSTDKTLNVYANRGASGIDGVISTALGISSTTHHSLLTTHHTPHTNNLLLIGDLSFYHDMNGLLAAKRYTINLTIVVVNNHGGGIFRKLSIDKNNPKFSEFWETPTDLSIKKIAELYGSNYFITDNQKDFLCHLETTKKSNGLQIIEAVVLSK